MKLSLTRHEVVENIRQTSTSFLIFAHPSEHFQLGTNVAAGYREVKSEIRQLQANYSAVRNTMIRKIWNRHRKYIKTWLLTVKNLKRFSISAKPSKPVIVMVFDGNTSHGGWVDRLKGIVSFYKISQLLDYDFKIDFTHRGVELMNLMNKINEPTLFWLDGHYSAGVTAKGEKDTPIYEEHDHILNAPDRGHVIIIDDARCFGSYAAHPSIEELTDFIKSKRQNLKIAVQDDSVRITPKQ